MENRIRELRHLLTTVFLSSFAGFMVAPVITDVTVAAVCSDPLDSCSLAVYLTGFQQVAIGVGTMIMMPVMGNLSDRYGIRTILTLPMCLSILPPVILGFRRDTKFFYVYYISKILTAMVCEGTVDCLAYAYVAENIHGSTRISAFGILAGIKTIAGLFGTLGARFLSIALVFQLFVLPRFGSNIGERMLLSSGLLLEVIYMATISISWAQWVPYLATIFVPGSFFVMPSVCGIASTQVGPGEQGKVQGCISGVRSFSRVVGPFVFSPLTALFLSENAPFYFPGFSIFCISLSSLIGFIQSLLIKNVLTPPSIGQSNQQGFSVRT